LPIDHVRFCADKYLSYSHAYFPAERRPDLVRAGEAALAAASADNASAIVGVQTIRADADDINFVVTERGLFLAATGKFYPFAEMCSQISHMVEDKHTFRRIEVGMEDTSSFELDVDSAHRVRLRDAYPVSSFLAKVRARIRQTHPAYRP
jgi:hypothetical protein